MYRQHIENVSNTAQQVDVIDYASGLYLIRVSTLGKRDAIQQVIIQK